MPEPPRSQLRRLLERPGARPRLEKAVGALLAAVVVSIGAIGALLIWHVSRRARVIREQLKPPKRTGLPDIEPRENSTMPGATFRRHERLTDARDFQRAFERRRSASDDNLIVYGVENGRSYCRLGLSVGRKKLRRAHDRNRFKRVVREAFRLAKAELPAGIDLVVVPKSPARLNLADVRRALPTLAQAVARRLRPQPVKAMP